MEGGERRRDDEVPQEMKWQWQDIDTWREEIRVEQGERCKYFFYSNTDWFFLLSFVAVALWKHLQHLTLNHCSTQPQGCWRSLQVVDREVLFKHCIMDENGSQMLERLKGNNGRWRAGRAFFRNPWPLPSVFVCFILRVDCIHFKATLHPNNFSGLAWCSLVECNLFCFLDLLAFSRDNFWLIEKPWETCRIYHIYIHIYQLFTDICSIHQTHLCTLLFCEKIQYVQRCNFLNETPKMQEWVVSGNRFSWNIPNFRLSDCWAFNSCPKLKKSSWQIVYGLQTSWLPQRLYWSQLGFGVLVSLMSSLPWRIHGQRIATSSGAYNPNWACSKTSLYVSWRSCVIRGLRKQNPESRKLA